MAIPVRPALVGCEFGVVGDRWPAGYHTGRDYLAAGGTTVRATLAGVVVRAGPTPTYGLLVVVESNGIRHFYAHLSAAAVECDAWVETGDRLGATGGDGLHYEERVAPYRYMDHRSPLFDLLEPLHKPLGRSE